MAIINSFRDLKVYQAARAQAVAIFRLTQSFPRDERFSLTDQIRRSSRAVNALLAESWARRRYEPAFVNKVNEAMGEAMETQAWLDHALDSGYVTKQDFARIDAAFNNIGAMLNRMIDRAADFCNQGNHQAETKKMVPKLESAK